MQKETPLLENENGNDVSDKKDGILPPNLSIAVNNNSGKSFTKAKSEPMTDSNNTRESSETPTSSEPSVVYGTQPGVISDTLKEMYKNLIRVECKMELNKICERDIRDWMDKEVLIANNHEPVDKADCKQSSSSDKSSNNVLPVKTGNQRGTKKRRPPSTVYNKRKRPNRKATRSNKVTNKELLNNPDTTNKDNDVGSKPVPKPKTELNINSVESKCDTDDTLPLDPTNDTNPAEKDDTKNKVTTDNSTPHDQSEHRESDSSVEISIRRSRRRKTTAKYVESDTSSTSDTDDIQPKKRSKTLNALKYPSASRIAARNNPTQQPTTSVKSNIRTRSKTKDDAYPASENGNTLYSGDESTGGNTGTESETNETGDELLPSSTSVTRSKKKGNFETTTRGIPVRKRNRKFYCTGCDQVVHSLAALNEHFRNTHSRVRCRTCGKPFDTPKFTEEA